MDEVVKFQSNSLNEEISFSEEERRLKRSKRNVPRKNYALIAPGEQGVDKEKSDQKTKKSHKRTRSVKEVDAQPKRTRG